ncbi:hypothetical protein [Mucilaginibacter sp.]|uniref:hypothetical protein n=1 Tax=Mucilaginibacter sp. TaxID=1882438 RepID=UPI0028425CE1|nr:hypothetical protein [Mucilaginibacter sp.]MDR3695888.1 hypothetical protein [Mucilaginibacter sp.]
MKKIVLFVLAAMVSIAANAQQINRDTLAKYSKKEEQLKVFSQIAADVHLDDEQSKRFIGVSAGFAGRALDLINNKTLSRHEKMQFLRKLAEDYFIQLKTFLTPRQISLLKAEREKYHPGKRFLAST